MPALYHQRAGAVKLAVFGDDVLLQCGGGGDDLEGGAGIVQERHRLVAPLLIDSFGSSSSPLFVVGNGIDLSLHPIRQLKGIVGVKVGIGGHGQDAAIVHVHDQADGRALHFIVVIGDLQILLQKMLQHLVDGQHQRLPLFGGIVQFIVLGKSIAVTVSKGDRPTCRTGKYIVIFLFQTGKSLLVGTYTAQYVSQKTAVGIISGGVAHEIQGTAQLVVVHKPAHQVGLILFDAPEDHLIGAVLGGLGSHRFTVHRDKGGQSLHDQPDAPFPDGCLLLVGKSIFLVFRKTQQRPLCLAQVGRFLGCDLPGIEDQHLGAGRNGKRLAVGIVNGATSWVERDIPGLITQRLLLVKILVDDLQEGQPDDDGGCKQHAKNRHHKHDAAPGMTVSFTVNLGHIGSFSGKTGEIVGCLKCENGARRIKRLTP